jgi:signal transduction histidine kinase
MHDDIGAGLTQITLISEFVKNQNKETSIKELNDIATTSRQLVSNMGEIIWSLNHENPTLGHLLSYLREQLNRQLEYSGIEFTIHFPDDGSTLKVSNVTRRNVLLATREIVNNAIKHSDATKIDVSAELKDNILLFRISDNGIGFDSDVVYTGNGLKNVRERITILGGQLKIRSNAGAGTVFEYSITPG